MKNSKLDFINLNKVKIKTIKIDRPGKYVAFMRNLSGNFVFEIESENVDLSVYGIFQGKNKDEFTVNTVQHHKAPNSRSNLLIKGVFDDRSKFHYCGLIKIEKKAQKTHAYQKNQNLILSKDAFVESEPFLEILANDVFCTHGSTTGRLNDEQIHYLKTRGIQSDKAKDLLVRGFVNEIINKLTCFL